MVFRLVINEKLEFTGIPKKQILKKV